MILATGCAMLKRLTITFSSDEREALDRAAQQELRPVKEQARYLLRCELARRGLLSSELPTLETSPSSPRATTAAL